MRYIFNICIGIILLVQLATAQNYQLDPSFHHNGYLIHDFGRGPDEAASVALLPGGKFLLGGTGWNGGIDFMVARFHADGSPDLSFGSRGRAFIDVSGDDRLVYIKALPDGKILLAGAANVGDFNGPVAGTFALARCLADGRIDSTFGNNGRVVTTHGIPDNYNNYATAALVQPDGKILLAGNIAEAFYPPGAADIALLRFTPGGAPDTTFGTGGVAALQVGPGHNEANGIALQADGKIIVAGVSDTLNGDIMLVRFHTNGIVDTSFGDGGITRANLYDPDNDFPFHSTDYASAVLVQPDSMIVVVGHSYHELQTRHLVAIRFSPDGMLDKIMPAVPGGIGTPEQDPVYQDGLAAALQPDGKIVAAGIFYTQHPDLGQVPSFFLVRFDTAGKTDDGFDGNGLKIIDIDIYDRAAAVAILPDGKILAAGHAYGRFDQYSDFNLESDVAMVRLDSAGVLDTDFANAGIAVEPFGTNTDWGTDVAVLPDGKILAGAVIDTLFPYIVPVKPGTANGSWSNYLIQNLPNFTVARYLEDGTADVGFGQNGRTGFTVNDLNEYYYGKDYRALFDAPYAPLKTAIAIRPNGNILVAGSREFDFGIAEFYPDGSQDSLLLGSAGSQIPQPPFVRRIDFNFGYDVATAIIVDSTIRPMLLTQGYTAAGYSGEEAAVAWCCHTVNLGGLGARRATVDVGPWYEYATAVGYQADTALNKVYTVAGGYYLNGGSGSYPRMFLFRLENEGDHGYKLDTTFGEAGIFRHQVGDTTDLINAFVIQEDNSIIAAGAVDDLMAVFRFLPDGSFDTGFGNNGVARLTAGFAAQDLAIQPNGRIVATGYSANKIVTIRLLSNGQPDPSFGSNGVLTTNLRDKKDRGFGVALQEDGKIVVTGSSDDPYAGTDFLLLRYLTNSSIPPLNVSATVQAVTCPDGDDGQIITTVAGGVPPYQFAWNTGDTATTISGLNAATYTVTVTDNQSGQVVFAIDVPEPDALAADFIIQNEARCNNQPGTASFTPAGGTPPYTQVWSSGHTGTTATLPAGGFTLTLTDNHGCTDVFDGIMPETPDTTPPLIACPAFIETQACSTGVQYNLPQVMDDCGATDPQLVSGLPPGSIFPEGLTLVMYQTADMAGNTAQCQFEVIVVNNLALAITADPACPGELNLLIASTAGGTLPYAFAWSNGDSSQVVMTTASGLFTVTLTDALGCTRSAMAFVQAFPPMEVTAAITPAWIDASNGGISATVSSGEPPYDYAWYRAGQPMGTGPVLSNIPGGDYTLIVTDAAGCMDTTVWNVPEVVATTEPGNVLQCRVYPNPFTEKLQLQLELRRSAEVRWQICDLTGRCYDEHAAGHTGYLQTELNTTDLPAGMYLLYIRIDGDTVQRKLVKIDKR
jgi:uncharacterized delta-60 repeat protein